MDQMRFVPHVPPNDPATLAKIRLPAAELQARLRKVMDLLVPNFVSIALFYNLSNPAATQNVNNYQNTVATDVTTWLNLGQPVTTAQFMRNYWSALSYGQFQFGVDSNRDASGNILIPGIAPANNDGQDWGDIASQIVRMNPERIWQLSGSKVDGGKRIIPSVVLVMHYDTHASALFEWGLEFSNGGQTYRVLDLFHISYDVTPAGSPAGPNLLATWATMAHEYSHNFVEGSDLYGGGGGKIGYWDLLGDSLAVGMMSDTSSYYKARLGWITFKNILNGPVMPAAEFRLQPYITSGEAIKVVPDPIHTPNEYFLLEFRTATGGDPNWTPDGGLKESGLLIAHINDRFGDGATGYLCSSPFMDIEEADRNDGKCWDNRAYCDLQWSDPPNAHAGSVGVSVYPPNNWPDGTRPAGVLYPFGNNNSFTPTSNPNSNFYGGRDSGLSITNIRKVGNEMVFTVEMTGNNQAVYQLGANDQYYFADFNADGKDELLLFNGNTLALLEHEQNQFHVIWQVQAWLGGWHFGNGDRLYIGDFNGDGRADVFIRSAEWAGLFICDGQSFTEIWMTGDPAQNQNWIGGWHLGPADSEYVGDFDGDGKDDIFIRSPQWAGLLLSTGSSFNNVWMTGDPVQNQNWIGGWHLGAGDRHYVGDFDGDGRDDIFIRSDQWAALLLATGKGFNNVWMTGDPAQNQNWIDGWHLGPGDRHIVGDFNGDGRDDIFIRSDQWAAVLTSDGSRLHVEWMSGDPAQNSNWVEAWQLTSADRELTANLNYSPNADVFVYRPSQQTGVFLMTEGGVPHVTWFAGSTFAAKSPSAPVDRFYRGRFTGGNNTDVLVFNGNQLVLYRNGNGSLQRIWQSGNWIGGWHLGFDDHLLIGDFNGDGRDDIFIRSPLWAGLLISTGTGFENVWMTGDPAQNQNWIGGWHLGPLDREYVGDFNGDGKADIYIRSPLWAGLLLSTGSGFENVWMTGDPAQNQNWIGGWHLGPMDREYIGDFNGDGKADIFIRSPHWAGLLLSTGSGFNNVWMTGDPAQNQDWIGGWHLGPLDRIHVGDFNGDGKADIFIRSRHWAGLLISTGTSFENVWMTGDPAQNQDWIGGWHLGIRDREVVGDFNGDGKADIYIRSDAWAGILLSRGNSFNSAFVQQNTIGPWQFNPADHELIGHYSGRANDEIFVYHPWGWTGVLTASAGNTSGQLNVALTAAQFRQITAR